MGKCACILSWYFSACSSNWSSRSMALQIMLLPFRWSRLVKNAIRWAPSMALNAAVGQRPKARRSVQFLE